MAAARDVLLSAPDAFKDDLPEVKSDPDCKQVMLMLERVLRSVEDCHKTLETQQSRFLVALQGRFDADDNSAHRFGLSMSRSFSSGDQLVSSQKEGSGSKLGEYEGCSQRGSRYSNGHDDIAAYDMKQKRTKSMELMRDLSTNKDSTFKCGADLFKLEVIISLLRAFVRHPRFDLIVGSVIFANSIYIGIQIEETTHRGADQIPPLLDYIFLIIYIVDLGLRFWAYGVMTILRSGWNIFDISIVSVEAVSLCIIAPINVHANLGSTGDFLQKLTLLRLLRLFKLLRLVRSLRLVAQFRILWGLVNGLIHALPTIFSTLALLCLLIYIFACCGVVLVTKDESMQSAADNNPRLREIVDTSFGSLPLVAMTLIRFTTMDDMSNIYEPLVREKPFLMIYFTSVLLVISITIMNLITAVIVQHSITMAKNDSQLEVHMKRKRIRKLIPVVDKMFNELDQDNDGLVTLEEAMSSRMDMPSELSDVLDADSLVELFEALDNDQSGAVNRDEFVEGLVELALSEVPIETVKLLHYGRLQTTQTRILSRQVETLIHAVNDNSQSQDLKHMFARVISALFASDFGLV